MALVAPQYFLHLHLVSGSLSIFPPFIELQKGAKGADKSLQIFLDSANFCTKRKKIDGIRSPFNISCTYIWYLVGGSPSIFTLKAYMYKHWILLATLASFVHFI